MSRRSKKREHVDSQAAAGAAFDAKVRKAFQGVENLVIQRAADITPNPVQWLWPNRIARGQLTLLAGDSGVGKSLLALDLAARVSTGAAWPDRPDEPQTPGNVLILTAHDDPASIGRPRLEQAGADLSRVFFVTGVDRKQNGQPAWKRQINLPDDLLSLSKTIMACRPIKLVVLDAAWVFCSRGSGGRSKRAGPALLAELAELAAMMQVAIVCVTDLSRDDHAAEGYRAAGERALLAAAPTEWGLVRDTQRPERQLMLSLKSNTGPRQPGLAFTIVDGRIAWESQTVKISGKAALAAEKSKGESARADAWLAAFLAAGPQPQPEVMRQGKECGFTEGRLRQAKKSLGASAEKEGFNGPSHWLWMLGDEWRARREKRGDARPEAAGLRREMIAASEEFESGIGACGERGEEKANGEGGRQGVTQGFEVEGAAMELESVNWDRERPPLPPIPKGGSEAAGAKTNGACAAAHIFDEATTSSSDLGLFCEDVVIAGAASSEADSQHLRGFGPAGCNGISRGLSPHVVDDIPG